MKLGILTLHSQQNYGGVLQCWALQRTLKGMGHEVVVVDRWLDRCNTDLRKEFAYGLRRRVRAFVRGLFGCGEFGKLLRTVRTIRFVRALPLTKEHFCDWSEIAHTEGLTVRGLDLLVVGSDQVWHCGDFGDPRPYLLEGAPALKAISYAASFGLKALPVEMTDLYRRGLARFSAISCREREGVDICRGLGYEAAHVVDPVLLVDPSEWRALAGDAAGRNDGRKLVCYFLSVDVFKALPVLEGFADACKCSVEVIADSRERPFPRSIAALAENFHRGRVKIRYDCGPMDFVRAFAGATWALTDSFHAVMFSSVFGCNTRFVRPADALRRTMFARVDEFATACVEGEFFVDDVAQALESFSRGETVSYNRRQIAARRAQSLAWLMENLKAPAAVSRKRGSA